MADNVTLNAGTGGDVLRTFADSDGTEWPAAVLSYVTTLSPGANVLTPASEANPLPVSATLTGNVVVSSIVSAVAVVSDDPANLLCTTNIASGQTLATVDTITNPVAATQSGSWDIGTVAALTSITNPVGVTQSGSWTMAATQSGTWTVGLSAAQTLANVTTLGTITNAVTVAQPTAGNLNATVSIASAQTLANVTTVGTITNAVTVSQGTASNLNATAVLAAGTALVGKTSTGADTSTIYSGTTALTPKFAKISASSSGDNTVVALVAGKKIRVIEWGLTASGTVGIKWRSNTTDLTGVRPMIQYASAGGSFSPVGRFETAAGEALNLNLSAAVSVGGDLAYLEV